MRYYGFDTTRPPFDDPRIRRAVAMAVDWDRLVRLDDPNAVVATSLVPAGHPGRGRRATSRRPTTPTPPARSSRRPATRAATGLPPITMITGGGGTDEALAAELERELGITVNVETMPFGDYNQRLADRSAADLQHRLDRRLPASERLPGPAAGDRQRQQHRPLERPGLRRRCSRRPPPRAIAAEQAAAYASAQRIIAEQAPVIPLRYGETWALSREGLLGANQSGLGYLRFAGLDWEGR